MRQLVYFEKMKSLFFLRHASTVSNERRVASGSETQFSATGTDQLKRLERNGLHCTFDLIVSSPEPRASLTTNAVLAGLIATRRPQVIYDIRARERDLGDLKGVPLDDVFKMTEQELEFRGAETTVAFRRRIAQLLTDLRRMRSVDSLLIVSHNAVGKMLQDVIDRGPQATPNDAVYDQSDFPNAALVTMIPGAGFEQDRRGNRHLHGDHRRTSRPRAQDSDQAH